MKEIELTEEFFDSEVLESDIPVLVDFWASWCGPCMMLAPTVEEIANEYAGTYKICKVNVDEAPALAMRFGIDTIPTLLIFSGGKLSDKSIGVVPKSKIIGMLENACGE